MDLSQPTATVEDFATFEMATVALIEALRTKKVTGDFAAYKVQSYNDKNEPVERVAPNDRDAAAADAQYLTTNNIQVRTAVSGLLAARQLYVALYKETERLLEKTTLPDPGNGEDATRLPHALVLEALSQAAANAASKPFSEIDLFEGLTHIVLPWLKDIIERNAKDEEADSRQRLEDFEKARRAAKVPIGIAAAPNEPPTLDREKPLVLVGYGPAISYLLSQVVTATLSTPNNDQPGRLFTVVHLVDALEIKPSGNDHLALVGRKAWDRCTRNPKTFYAMIEGHIMPQVRFLPDLLVCDDLASAGDHMITGGDMRQSGGIAPFRCADALMKLMKWCKHCGAGMVAGVPGPDAMIDLGTPEWERLRNHAVLRPVNVIRRAANLPEGKARIEVGGYASFEVDAKVLLPSNRIILP